MKKINSGSYTPYYYVGDGQRIAFVRVGEESLPATAEQMVRLVLKGSNKTYDSLHTDYKAEDYAFTILAKHSKPVQVKNGIRNIFSPSVSLRIQELLLMLGHCLQMIVHCGSLVCIVLDGKEKQKAMPSMMQSLLEMY